MSLYLRVHPHENLLNQTKDFHETAYHYHVTRGELTTSFPPAILPTR
jgi:hypothetical protein